MFELVDDNAVVRDTVRPMGGRRVTTRPMRGRWRVAEDDGRV